MQPGGHLASTPRYCCFAVTCTLDNNESMFMGTSAFMGTSGHICAAVWMHVCNKTTQGSPTEAQKQEVKQESMKYISNKPVFSVLQANATFAASYSPKSLIYRWFFFHYQILGFRFKGFILQIRLQLVGNFQEAKAFRYRLKTGRTCPCTPPGLLGAAFRLASLPPTPPGNESGLTCHPFRERCN